MFCAAAWTFPSLNNSIKGYDMEIKRNVTMIGDFTDRGPKLFTEKAAGNVCGCIGFVKDRNTRLNVPNT